MANLDSLNFVSSTVVASNVHRAIVSCINEDTFEVVLLSDNPTSKIVDGDSLNDFLSRLSCRIDYE